MPRKKLTPEETAALAAAESAQPADNPEESPAAPTDANEPVGEASAKPDAQEETSPAAELPSETSPGEAVQPEEDIPPESTSSAEAESPPGELTPPDEEVPPDEEAPADEETPPETDIPPDTPSASDDGGEAPLLIEDSDDDPTDEPADDDADNSDNEEPVVIPAKPPAKKRAKETAEIKTRPLSEAFAPPGNDLILRPRTVLTIESNETIASDEDKAEELWHDIQNARRMRRTLTGTLVGIEMTEAKKPIAIVYYRDQRVVIPISELLPYDIEETSVTGATKTERLSKIANNMLGCDIDFVIAGIDKRSRSVVASRKEAMLKKRRRFYLTLGDYGLPQVHEGRTVQARIIAVSAYNIRVDVFGVETVIPNQDLSWEWLANATEKYSVGEKILVKVNRVEGDNVKNLKIKADVKSLLPNNIRENLLKVSVQGKYMGIINNINHGVIYLRLKNGVNAVAHTCLDRRAPGVNDEVAFVVTGINWDHNDAEGLITKIIRQNI